MDIKYLIIGISNIMVTLVSYTLLSVFGQTHQRPFAIEASIIGLTIILLLTGAFIILIGTGIIQISPFQLNLELSPK